MGYGVDLARKGEMDKIKKMEELANRLEKETNGGLSGVYITEGYEGKYDMIHMVATSEKYSGKEGYVLYDLIKEEAFFAKK